MKKWMMLLAVLASAGLLAACGNGGQGDVASDAQTVEIEEVEEFAPVEGQAAAADEAAPAEVEVVEENAVEAAAQ